MAVIENLKIDRGTTWSQGFAMFTEDALPLEDDWTVSAVVKESSESTGLLHTFASALIGGVLYLSVLPATSASWTWKHGVYEVRISKNGLVDRVFSGQVFVR